VPISGIEVGNSRLLLLVRLSTCPVSAPAFEVAAVDPHVAGDAAGGREHQAATFDRWAAGSATRLNGLRTGLDRLGAGESDGPAGAAEPVVRAFRDLCADAAGDENRNFNRVGRLL